MKFGTFPTQFVTTRNLLIITVIYMIFPLYLLPKSLHALQTVSGKPDILPLGMRPGFTPEIAWQTLEALGASGRNVYLYSELYMDSCYALVYGIFFSFLIVFLFKLAGGRLSRMTVVAWFPIAGTIADWIENIGIVKMITMYPEQSNMWARITSVAGQAKWFFSGVGLLYIMVGLAVWAWKIIKTKP